MIGEERTIPIEAEKTFNKIKYLSLILDKKTHKIRNERDFLNLIKSILKIHREGGGWRLKYTKINTEMENIATDLTEIIYIHTYICIIYMYIYIV